MSLSPEKLNQIKGQWDGPVASVDQLELYLKRFAKLGFTNTSFYVKDAKTLKKVAKYLSKNKFNFSAPDADESSELLVEVDW